MQTACMVLWTFLGGWAHGFALSGPGGLGKRDAPTVLLATGTVVGSARQNTDNFNGIPYAQPPTGDLRLRPPVRLNSSMGTMDASGLSAAACPQMILSDGGYDFPGWIGALTNLPFLQKALSVSEDCLTVNVVRPKGTQAGDKLPVLYWIFGGGFELGWSSMYDATGLVSNAVNNGKPYVFVGVNYRVGGFGFLPGAEVLAGGAANLGLLDQRMGLEWVADNIDAFGGDATKVTIWGQSAGALSVLDQMLLHGGDNTYHGAPLFRAAIMSSGSIAPTDPVDCPKAQAVFDHVATNAGCASQNDKLACLRAAPYATFLAAANSVPGAVGYTSVALSYLPRPDGTALPASPDVMVANGRYAAVPMMVGDQEDEGTFFAITSPNVTTADSLATYLSSVFFLGATRDQMAELVATYDASPAAGSPFGTGMLNEIRPGFKRVAAVLGDMVFTLARRVFLSSALARNPNVPAWSYLASYDRGTPVLGTFHGSDLLQVFYGLLPNYASRTIQSYFANFVWNLDPNDASRGTGNGSAVALTWPRWTPGERQLVQFWADRGDLIKDDFREGSYEWIVSHMDFLRE